MQQSNSHLSKRDEKLLAALEVHGESRLSEFKKDFEVSEYTLRRDLGGLEGGPALEEVERLLKD